MKKNPIKFNKKREYFRDADNINKSKKEIIEKAYQKSKFKEKLV